jgi:hypothetical protein
MQDSADVDAFWQAYRKLAMKHHPDTNKNDPAAAAKFSEVRLQHCVLRLRGSVLTPCSRVPVRPRVQIQHAYEVLLEQLCGMQ